MAAGEVTPPKRLRSVWEGLPASGTFAGVISRIAACLVSDDNFCKVFYKGQTSGWQHHNFCNRNALLTTARLVILSDMEDGKFSRYVIRGELGKGGMAEVYRAYDPYSGREVALKILRREYYEDPEFRERFDREMKIVAQLEFDGIVQVYDFGRDEQEPLFFVMRLMPGGTLSDKIENGSLSADQIPRIIQRIASVLDQAHQRGIIHRDLKPKNILFDKNDNAFISDFGVAKAIDKSAPNASADSSVIVGTPRYMSPEQANSEKVDERSDVYSLGVIAFEMLVGKTNFETITPWGLALDRETNIIPRLLDTNSALTHSVREVMERVLAKDSSQRYGSATEFASALTAALAEPEAPTQPASHSAPLSLRFWLIGGFISFALIVSFAKWGYPILFPPTTPTNTVTVTSAPSATVTPPMPTVPATQTLTETPAATEIVVIPPGSADRIALTANNEIYLLTMDGSDFDPLTSTRLPKFDLQWLPGGKELLYVEGSCVYTIQVEPVAKEPEKLTCFTDPKFLGFRVSPDGQRVAISIANRLLVLSFDRAMLSTVSSAFELQKLESLCLDYSEVTVKGAQWSADGQRLAVRYQTAVSVSNRLGDVIRVLQGDWERCQKASVWDDFPANHFVPDGYERYSVLPSYHWDGNSQFLLNSFIRNLNYGDLYLYDMSTELARKINPINGLCCYGPAVFSPDGTHILLVFQDLRLGSNNKNLLYYIRVDQIGTATQFSRLPLPGLFFQDPRENIQLALRPFAP
jgi:serine/threonine protein kinase